MGITTKHSHLPQMESERLRRYISDLDQAVSKRPELVCGIVRPSGDTALNVIRIGSARRFAEITALDVFGCAWFVWVTDGGLIGSVDDAEGVAHTIALELTHAVQS